MGRGTGLGLASVYGIIKSHSGAIDVQSEPGEGTTFIIYLPASNKEAIAENMTNGMIANGNETILLVDDEDMILTVNTAQLESMGYRVCSVTSGPEAIAICQEKKIDLVILDMTMPGMSGEETFFQLRNLNPRIKVLLSSGYALNGKIKAIIEQGCNGFLQKPFLTSQLSQKVREILES